MENTQGQQSAPEQGTTQPPAQEMVPVEEASNEDLEQALEDLLAQEKSPPKAEPAKAQEAHPDADEEVSADAEVEESTDTEPKQEEDKTDHVSREEHEKLKRQLEGVELLMKRRTSDLAEHKKILQQLVNEKRKGLQERMAEDPVGATEDILAIKKAQEDIQDIDQEHAHLEASRQNRSAVLNHVNLVETPIDDIANAFLDDGVPAQIVEQFKRDPFSAAFPATTTIQAAKRVRAEKVIRQLLPVLKKLKAENAQLKGRGSDVTRKIEQTARKFPEVTGANGGAIPPSSKQQGFDEDKPIEEWSDKELEEYTRRVGSR
jgi:molecular chaperone GrpE (heat shock protein)